LAWIGRFEQLNQQSYGKDKMVDKKQKIIIIVGLTLGILCGLFPPRVRIHQDKKLYALHARRGFLFSSNLYFKQHYDPVTKMGTSAEQYSIDQTKLFIEWMFIGMSTALAAIICYHPRVKKDYGV
jgi:hypothetical protein